MVMKGSDPDTLLTIAVKCSFEEAWNWCVAFALTAYRLSGWMQCFINRADINSTTGGLKEVVQIF